MGMLDFFGGVIKSTEVGSALCVALEKSSLDAIFTFLQVTSWYNNITSPDMHALVKGIFSIPGFIGIHAYFHATSQYCVGMSRG
jgi:hypothetical protein